MLLLSGSKAPGKAPAIHPPWKKARVRPADDRDQKRCGLQQRSGGGGVGLFENGEAGRRESREGMRGRERELQRKSIRNGVNHEARYAERGEEQRGTLPGLLSTNRYHSLDGGVFINGSYFQTCKPSPVKQKLSEALGLISSARRLQGLARVGSEDCSGVRGWHGGGRPCSRMHAPVGGRSVSAWVSQRDVGLAGRRGGENSESEVWWTRGKPRPSSDSETGSTASSSEFSTSVESSTNSSVTTKPEATESGSETEKQDWEMVEEETADTELERQNRSEGEQKRGSGLEGEVRSKPSESVAGGNSVNSEGGNSSAKLHQESAETNMKSVAAPPSSPPPRSSQDTTEEEVEEDEEVRNVLSLTLASQASSSEPDIASGVTKTCHPSGHRTQRSRRRTKARLKKRGIWGMSRLIEMQRRPDSHERWNSSALSKILGVQSPPGWSGFL